jgi:hypothetical protein
MEKKTERNPIKLRSCIIVWCERSRKCGRRKNPTHTHTHIHTTHTDFLVLHVTKGERETAVGLARFASSTSKITSTNVLCGTDGTTLHDCITDAEIKKIILVVVSHNALLLFRCDFVCNTHTQTHSLVCLYFYTVCISRQ